MPRYTRWGHKSMKLALFPIKRLAETRFKDEQYEKLIWFNHFLVNFKTLEDFVFALDAAFGLVFYNK